MEKSEKRAILRNRVLVAGTHILPEEGESSLSELWI